MKKSSHCFSIILSLLQHGIKSLIFVGVFFYLFFLLLNGFRCILLSHQRSYHHPKLPRSSTSPPYNQFRIVSYFCVLGFVYIYSFLINAKVKPLFLNNPLSTSTLGICFKFLDALTWVVWNGMTCGKIGGVWSSKHAIFLRDFWSIRKPELKGVYWVISSKTIFRNKILFETSNIKYRFLDCEGSLQSRIIQIFLAYSHCFLEYFLKTS